MTMIFLQLMISLAAAADVAPREASTLVSVRSGDETYGYHMLVPGKDLSFPTAGPGKWGVEARQRIAGTSQRAAGSIEVLGNGVHAIMTIKLKSSGDKNSQIEDRHGGALTSAERVWITVPEGGKFVTLRAPAGSRDTLVRLFTKDGGPTAVVAAEPAEESDDPPEDDVSPEEPAPEATLDDAPPERRPPPSTGKGEILVGGTMGLGIPARGTKAVGYIGFDARYPVFRELISVGGGMGWYRIGVEQEVQIADPHLGHTTIVGDWRTDVFPFVARGIFHAPLQLGPVQPVAGAGIGMFIARRVDGTEKTTRVGIGPELLAGAEMDLGHLGRVGSHLTWTEARMRLGNTGPDGEEVKETIAHTRLNLTWMTSF